MSTVTITCLLLVASRPGADCDGDGLPADLVTVSRFSVRFFLGEPAGPFREGTPIRVGSNPRVVLAEDLDADGDVDAATANAVEASGEVPGNISILLNRGAADFASPRNLAAGLTPTALTSDDFDGDGRVDLVASNLFSGDLTFFMNLGGGSFGFAETFPVGPGPQSLMAADLDGDGDRDLVMTLEPRDALLGFLERLGTPAAAGGQPDACGVSFRRGDFNQDGRLDVADPVSVLTFLFAGAVLRACLSAADATDDGTVNITDGISLLLHLFRGGGVLPEPFSSCGGDPTPDLLGCAAFEACG